MEYYRDKRTIKFGKEDLIKLGFTYLNKSKGYDEDKK